MFMLPSYPRTLRPGSSRSLCAQTDATAGEVNMGRRNERRARRNFTFERLVGFDPDRRNTKEAP